MNWIWDFKTFHYFHFKVLPSVGMPRQRHPNARIWFNRRILKFYAKLNENGTMNLRRWTFRIFLRTFSGHNKPGSGTGSNNSNMLDGKWMGEVGIMRREWTSLEEGFHGIHFTFLERILGPIPFWHRQLTKKGGRGWIG